MFKKKAYEERGVRALAITKLYIAIGWGKFIDIYNVGTNLIITTLKGHKREVFCL